MKALFFVISITFLLTSSSFATSNTAVCEESVANQLETKGYLVQNLSLDNANQEVSGYYAEGIFKGGYGLDYITVDKITCDILDIYNVWAE